MSSSDNPQLASQTPVSVVPITSVPVALDCLPAELSSVPMLPLIVQDPVWSGWDVLLIVVLMIATLIVGEVLTAFVAWQVVYRHSNFFDVAQKTEPALIGQFLSYIAGILLMIMFVEGKYHTSFWRAIRWNWRRKATVALLGLGVLSVVLDLLGNRYLPMPKTTPFNQLLARPTAAFLIAIFSVTLGPLMEELVFRGFLYPALARRTGIIWAVILTSVLFGAMHYPEYKSWAAVLVVTLVGVVLTTVRAVTKSVASSFLVHVGYNGTLMTLLAVATDGFRHMDKAATIRF